MQVKDAIDTLRRRFIRLREGETFENLQDVIRVHRMRLSSFTQGAILKYDDLEKIEIWCDTKEHLLQNTAPNGTETLGNTCP